MYGRCRFLAGAMLAILAGHPLRALADPSPRQVSSLSPEGPTSIREAQDALPPEPRPRMNNAWRNENGERDYLGLAESPFFLPRSYLYWGTPVGPPFARNKLTFGLEYALILPFYNDLRRKALLGKSFAGAVTLTFEGALRMLARRSNPVRMPTYRPTLSGQFFYLRYGRLPTILGLRFGVFHESNGQEGCTFDASLREGSYECRVTNANVQDPQRELNRKTGDFATSGWLLELHGRLHRVSAKGTARAHVTTGLSMWMNAKRTSARMYPEIRELYGWGRLVYTVQAWSRLGRSALALRGALHGYPKTDPRIPALAGLVELQWDPYWLSGVGFFVRYYGGRDFYNAFFVDTLQQFAAGLVWQAERPLVFKSLDGN